MLPVFATIVFLLIAAAGVLFWRWRIEIGRRNDLLDAVVLERAKLRATRDFLRKHGIPVPAIVHASTDGLRFKVEVCCGCSTCLQRWATSFARTALAQGKG